jgi:hypothetical protein
VLSRPSQALGQGGIRPAFSRRARCKSCVERCLPGTNTAATQSEHSEQHSGSLRVSPLGLRNLPISDAVWQLNNRLHVRWDRGGARATPNETRARVCGTTIFCPGVRSCTQSHACTAIFSDGDRVRAMRELSCALARPIGASASATDHRNVPPRDSGLESVQTISQLAVGRT